MRDGYAFELTGGEAGMYKDWRGSSDERWDTVVYSPKGDEKLVGGRFIDGSQVRVYRCRDGKYRAQVAI